MKLPQLVPAQSKCRLCDLHTSCESVGIPSRPAFPPHGVPDALLIVGEAPGYHEDNNARNFVGPSGKLLDIWIQACNFKGNTDVYLSNAVRCHPPSNADPSPSQVRACLPYLVRDLKAISKSYKRVAILCVGSQASKALTGRILTKNLSRQSEPVLVGDTEYPTFYTRHPASILPGRSPEQADAVMHHLDLVCRWFSGDLRGDEGATYAPQVNPLVPSYPIEALSIDLETYGIDEKYTQTQFVPARSIHVDQVPKKDLVHVVSISWKDPQGHYQNGVFNYRSALHRSRLKAFKRRARVLVFKNAQFDLAYLRATGFPIDHTDRVEELDVWAYLYSDVRPEHSLKSLVPIHGFTPYEGGGFKQYRSAMCRQALRYAAKDAIDTLRLRDVLLQNIANRYGPGSPKLSERTHKWFSDLVWHCVYMTEHGACIDRKALLNLKKSLEAKLKRVSSVPMSTLWVDTPDGVIHFSGKGSQKPTQDMIDEAAEVAGVLDHDELELTKKTGKISTSDGNLYLISAHLDADHPLYEGIEKLREFRASRKILSTYILPLVGPFPVVAGKERRDCEAIVTTNANWGITHPRWHPVPGPFGDTDTGVTGTKQGRITCKGPPMQTFPKPIKKAIITRHNPGFLLFPDLSQIELRVAAIVSGDSKMLREYREGIDRHWLRACEIFHGKPCSEHGAQRNLDCPTCDLHRQLGKQVNFLIIYWGGAYRLRATAREEVGMETSLEFCQDIVTRSHESYPEYMNWCEDHIKQVSQKGYYEDPIIGGGRRFTTSRLTNYIDKSTIVNFPIQYTAAYILLSVEVPLDFHLREHGFESRVVHNCYDAFAVDGPKKELDKVREIAYNMLQDSWYVSALGDHYGRMIPLLSDESLVEVG